MTDKTSSISKIDSMQYHKTDGIIALCFYGLDLFRVYFCKTPEMGSLLTYVTKHLQSFFLYTPPFSYSSSANDWALTLPGVLTEWSLFPIICIILAIRKQRLSSLGFRKHHNLRACLIGTAAGILLALLLYCLYFFQGYHGVFGKLRKLKPTMITPLLYVITVGLPEEIEFRAFLQSRIRGILKNRYVAVIIVGLMFCGSHIFSDFLSTPVYLDIGKDWIITEICNRSVLFGFHCLWLFLYKKTDNILAAALCHGIYDYIIFAIYC